MRVLDIRATFLPDEDGKLSILKFRGEILLNLRAAKRA
jgi:hypothetical protein